MNADTQIWLLQNVPKVAGLILGFWIVWKLKKMKDKKK